MSFRILAIAALLGAGLSVAPAHATQVCLENNTLTFAPPLTTANQTGTVTLDVSNTCADAPLLTPGQTTTTFNFNYFGSCLVALFSEGTGESFLVGSVLYVVVNASATVKVEILLPDTLCPGPVTVAHGTGVSIHT